MVEDKLISQLANILDQAMSEHFVKEQESPAPKAPYTTLEEYTTYTNKRFRMTKDQKARNLTREQAFEEYLRENYSRPPID
jgi:hypothetical protein